MQWLTRVTVYGTVMFEFESSAWNFTSTFVLESSLSPLRQNWTLRHFDPGMLVLWPVTRRTTRILCSSVFDVFSIFRVSSVSIATPLWSTYFVALAVLVLVVLFFLLCTFLVELELEFRVHVFSRVCIPVGSGTRPIFPLRNIAWCSRSWSKDGRISTKNSPRGRPHWSGTFQV